MAGIDCSLPTPIVQVIDDSNVDPNVHSASASPFLAASRVPVEHLSDPEMEHDEGDGSSNEDDGLTPTGSDGLNMSRRAQSPNNAEEAVADEEGLLPRDIQRKTAYYDYASEKQVSHEEAKQLYQRHQLETRSVAGSTDDFANLSP